MPKTAMIRARIEPELKHKAERVFSKIGLSPTQAITLFYRQVDLRDGLPFDVSSASLQTTVIPNATTRKTFESTDAGRDLVVCKDAADMFKKLGI